MRSSCACAMPETAETIAIAIAISRARLHPCGHPVARGRGGVRLFEFPSMAMDVPRPAACGRLPASGVTGLQVAQSFFGDFLEFVFNAAIEYRFARCF